MLNIIITNSKGEYIKSIINKYHQVGQYYEQWNGTDDGGRKMASGIYFYKIILGGISEQGKMIYLK